MSTVTWWRSHTASWLGSGYRILQFCFFGTTSDLDLLDPSGSYWQVLLPFYRGTDYTFPCPAGGVWQDGKDASSLLLTVADADVAWSERVIGCGKAWKSLVVVVECCRFSIDFAWFSRSNWRLFDSEGINLSWPISDAIISYKWQHVEDEFNAPQTPFSTKKRVTAPSDRAYRSLRSCSIPDTSATWRMIMYSFEHKEAKWELLPRGPNDSCLWMFMVEFPGHLFGKLSL